MERTDFQPAEVGLEVIHDDPVDDEPRNTLASEAIDLDLLTQEFFLLHVAKFEIK
jgi:hypothetical protein